ncbi:hypothetical protein GCM10020367_20530 [Streptomyces sannanensis]|uniref:Uncharacterized protein n=1 Tax=Streptomyces sannanensis TaxID=285536 RepID=A0ABP6S8Y1_9ACTN
MYTRLLNTVANCLADTCDGDPKPVQACALGDSLYIRFGGNPNRLKITLAQVRGDGDIKIAISLIHPTCGPIDTWTYTYGAIGTTKLLELIEAYAEIWGP